MPSEGFVRAMSRVNVWLYRKTNGRVGSRLRGAPVLLLTTTGRSSGELRTTPLLYLRDGEAYVVVASFGGSPNHPAWFLNIQANPEVEIQVGAERSARRARAASEQERERLWPTVVAMYPAYANYQTKTTRRIPVVLLEPPARA
jgi:deazaflavin-dependent oxidoreductase (nitroreductase family)